MLYPNEWITYLRLQYCQARKISYLFNVKVWLWCWTRYVKMLQLASFQMIRISNWLDFSLYYHVPPGVSKYYNQTFVQLKIILKIIFWHIFPFEIATEFILVTSFSFQTSRWAITQSSLRTSEEHCSAMVGKCFRMLNIWSFSTAVLWNGLLINKTKM